MGKIEKGKWEKRERENKEVEGGRKRKRTGRGKERVRRMKNGNNSWQNLR